MRNTTPKWNLKKVIRYIGYNIATFAEKLQSLRVKPVTDVEIEERKSNRSTTEDGFR